MSEKISLDSSEPDERNARMIGSVIFSAPFAAINAKNQIPPSVKEGNNYDCRIYLQS